MKIYRVTSYGLKDEGGTQEHGLYVANNEETAEELARIDAGSYWRNQTDRVWIAKRYNGLKIEEG